MRTFLLPGIALLLVMPAISQGPTPKPAPIGVVNGEPIYESDLTAALGQVFQLRKQQYEVEKSGLDSAINQKLLRNEATKYGISPEELLLREVDGKVPTATDGEVEAFYLAQPDRQQHPFEEAKLAMRNALQRARVDKAREEYILKLREQAHIEVLLEEPRLHVSYDPTRLKGKFDAPVRIVEFSDFECPYCRAAEQTVQKVLAKYGDQVSLAYRDFPLNNIHPRAELAAEASHCAAEQKKYWEYHDRLFASPGLEEKDLKAHAAALAMDTRKFDACIDEHQERSVVDQDSQDGRLAGVTGTPAFFVNGVPLIGAQPASEFERVIDQELARFKSAQGANRR